MTGLLGAVPPVGWARARGANVVDVDGNVYVDLTGGFGAALVGHRNPRVMAAVRAAAGRMVHALADAAPHPDRVRLAEMLVEKSPIRSGRVVFAQSGAEAVDIALKTAHRATGHFGVVAFEGAYHGTSLGALRATDRSRFRAGFEDALAPATLRVPYADCFRCPYQLRHPACGLACADAAVAEVDTWNTDPQRPPLGAWIVEPILGREGVVVPPAGWLKRIGQAARRRGLVVIADEILTGGGRTGRWWAGGALRPDLVCVGKGITGGLPIAAVIGRARLMRAWSGLGEARHTSTFMAHALAVAGTIAAIGEIDRRGLAERARAIGRHLGPRLRAVARRYPVIGDVRGRGAMWGLDFVTVGGGRTPDPDRAVSFARRLVSRGYFALAGGRWGNVVALLPPLTVTDRQLAGATNAIEAVAEETPPAG